MLHCMVWMWPRPPGMMFHSLGCCPTPLSWILSSRGCCPVSLRWMLSCPAAVNANPTAVLNDALPPSVGLCCLAVLSPSWPRQAGSLGRLSRRYK
jgi:hypothetical protein